MHILVWTLDDPFQQIDICLRYASSFFVYLLIDNKTALPLIISSRWFIWEPLSDPWHADAVNIEIHWYMPDNFRYQFELHDPWCKWGRSVLDRLSMPVQPILQYASAAGHCMFGHQIEDRSKTSYWTEADVVLHGCASLNVNNNPLWSVVCWGDVGPRPVGLLCFLTRLLKWSIYSSISFLTTRCTCTK